MKEAKEKFNRYLKRRYRDSSTTKHYMSDLSIFISQMEPKRPEEVTKQDIEQFVQRQVENGLKSSTINRRLATLHTFFEYLASESPDANWVNPVSRQWHRVKQGQRLPRDAKDGEVEQLFAVIGAPRDRAMFGLMVGVGLRVGEVATLQCSNLEEPTSTTGLARLLVKGKGGKERIVWVTPTWYQMVADWLRQRPEAETNHLFLNQHKRPLSVGGIQYRWRQYCQEVGIHLTCHQLRHTFARRLAEQRMPIESIAKILGHAQVETTQGYTAGANPDLRDAFLAAMTGVENQVAKPTTQISAPLPVVKSTVEVADKTALDKAKKRLKTLPPELYPLLEAYIFYRWRNWSAHRAADNVRKVTSQIVLICRYLVDTHDLSDWSQLHRSHLEGWLAARQAAGLANSSLRTALTVFLGFLRFALDHDIPINANLFRLQLPTRNQPLPRFLSTSDWQQLQQTILDQTAGSTYRQALDRAWFLTLAHTGLRLSECLNLRLADIDFQQRYLAIRQPKNRCDRLVFLTPALLTALAHYLTLRPTVADDHLWLTDKSIPLSDEQVRYRLNGWGSLCQVSVSPHRLRHTLATHLVNQHMPLETISKLLGHRSLDSTQHYARLFEHTVKADFATAIEKIEGIVAVDWPQLPIHTENDVISVSYLTDLV